MAEPKSPDGFAEEVKLINPNVILLGKYKRFGDSISCRCSKCGFPGEGVWTIMPQNLLKSNACPNCAGRQLNALFRGINDLRSWCENNDRLDILEDWDYEENKKDPNTPNTPEEIARSNPRIECHWKCCACGATWTTTANKRTTPDKKTHNTSNCPRCSKAGTSFTELALIYYLKVLFPNLIVRDRQQIGKELDIYIPTIKTAIECDGYMYHKNKIEADNIKDDLCKRAGISLIRVRDSRLPATESATIITSYGIQDYSGFETAIRQLIMHCGESSIPDINIKRDYGKIITDYKRSVLKHSLRIEYPDIAAEWHPTKNGVLKPENFTPGEDFYAWWKCSKCDHEWQAHIYSRTIGESGCPRCKLVQQGQTYRRNRANRYSFEKWCNDNNMTILLSEWDYEANRDDPKCPDIPANCPYGSPRPVHWICHVCGYKWTASPAQRKEKRGVCYRCRGRILIPGYNDLKTWSINNNKVYLLDDWDYSQNESDEECPDRPEMIRYNQYTSVHWKCHICGNKWSEEVGKRTGKNRQCRKCAILIRSSKLQKRVRNVDTGVIYQSIKEAEIVTTGKYGHSIIACCKGQHKTAYGFHWEYVDQ